MNLPTDPSQQSTVTPRGAVAIITNRVGDLLLHLRDDLPGIPWAGHWSLLGGSCEPGELPAQAIARELLEEAELAVDDLIELFETKDTATSARKIITFFAGTWDGEESTLPLAEGVKLQFFAPDQLPGLALPPFIRDGINHYLGGR
ncbi:NUDIX domain-containing protein [Kitasatospora sp. NPDC051853]|uniref:NUDIX domain-containing protein n=1 Tax=Kitasatospora sp. NPDC051853 TaxID=3364058 RepID=UPI0037B56262